MTLLYGENGTGKTTICDAFEFLANERVSSISNYGLGNALEKFWHSAKRKPADLLVELETSAETFRGKLNGKSVEVTPAGKSPKIELLRRQQMLRLIEAKPAERYNEIKRFVDISGFEVSEDNLRKQIKLISERKENSKQAEKQSLEELHGFFQAAGSPENLTPISWAKKNISEANDGLDSNIGELAKLRDAFNELKKNVDIQKARLHSLELAQSNLAAARDKLESEATELGRTLINRVCKSA
ncbi:hypothetical protein RvVAR0630_11520 [Agrobacterium vitis]|nr:hypothetical protein RvVAR0630_11520 [Agrobacterium vitis]